MTDGCCSRLKQIEARIVRYKNKPDPNKDKKNKACAEAQKETHQFQGRVSNLKSKLDEANANIALLRAWVGQADIDIQKTTPRTPKSKEEKLEDMVNELRELIVKLNDHQHQFKISVDRSKDACKMLDEAQNEQCFCSLVSASCEKIKKELADILEVKEELDNTIHRIKHPEEYAKNIEDDACTAESCVKQAKKLIDSSMQHNFSQPSKIPKLVNQGTNPCCGIGCIKPSGK